MTTTGKSLCRGKSVKNPNRCKKVTGCKVASGKERTYCRKKHNVCRTKTRKVTKGKSLCKGKSVKNPNRCKKMTGCKVATGKERSFCRKKHNHCLSAKKEKSPESPHTRKQKKMNRLRKQLSTDMSYRSFGRKRYF